VTSHPLSLLDLSAYRDSALDAPDRQLVESHIESCAACQERLAEYAWLGGALRSATNARTPARVDERVAALLRSRGEARSRLTLPRLWAPRHVWAAVAVAALLVMVLLIGLPGRDGAFGPTVASAYLFDDQGTPTIRVQFSGDVNKETVAQSLRIEPAVAVEISWQGGDMVVRPSEPLRPSERYTLSVNPSGRQTAATPVALQFTGDPPGTPVPLVARPAPSPASLAVAVATETATPTSAVVESPAATSTETPPTATATPLPTETATPAATASPSPLSTAEPTSTPIPTWEPTPSPTPADPQPWSGLDNFLESNPGLAAQLGKAKGKEESTDIIVQRFQKGLLLWRADTGATLLLVNGSSWQSYPATGRPSTPDPDDAPHFGPIARLLERNPGIASALGVATTPALPWAGVSQGYQHGSVLWSSGGTILVLQNRGSWEEHPNPDRDGRTPVPSSTATLAALSTATPSPAEEATPTAIPAPTGTPEADRPPATASTATPTLEPASDLETPTPTATAPGGDGAEPGTTATPNPAPTATPESTMTGGYS
jgi:hypothetical protein